MLILAWLQRHLDTLFASSRPVPCLIPVSNGRRSGRAVHTYMWTNEAFTAKHITCNSQQRGTVT